MDYYVKKNINRNSNYLAISKTFILKEKFFTQPEEIIFRSLSEVMQKVGNRKFSARGSKVENLINYLKSKKNLKKKTLSGCIIQKINNSVIIYSENGKIISNDTN